MLSLSIVKRSGQFFRDEIPEDLAKDFVGASVWIGRREFDGEFGLLTAKSVNAEGRVLLVFPDSESVGLRSDEVVPFSMDFEHMLKLAEEGGCIGIVLSMGGAWVEATLSAVRRFL